MATKEGTVLEIQAPLPSGAVIQGRYIVESLLGKGDFGIIYLVRDQHKKQKLFVLAEVFNTNEEESYRFTLEYIAPTPLDDQALPRVQYVVNDDKLRRAYVLMSYIEEPTLEILRLQQPEKRFPLSKVMTFMVPVINVLNYLHHQNPPVIHQNINPTNIIVLQTLNAPVLITLDLVKECKSTTTTLPYFVPGYNAPEQYREEISTRTDIYALGATCYTLLTGIILPDAHYRTTQLKNGEVDPLKPLDEVIPTIPAFMVEAIQRAMSLNVEDRFSSVQQFERALLGDRRFQESPTLKLHPRLPEQNLFQKADLVEQKPLEPMIAPRSTTLINSVNQLSPELSIFPSIPTVQQALVPEVPPLLDVTEELPLQEVVPSTLANEEPPAPELVAPAMADCEPSVPEVVPLLMVAEEIPVPEVVSSALTQSPVISEKAVETPAESLPGQPPTMLSRKPDTSRPSSSRQTVEKPATVPDQRRAWKFGVLHIVLTLLIGFGISVILWSDIPIHPSAHARVPTPGVKSSIQTPTPASSIYPMLTGMYSGTIYDISVNVSTSMLLSGIQQNQENISGYLTLGPKMQGSGPFSGTIDTTEELKFVVTGTKGNATLFFEGVMQSETNLTGDYYRCSSVGPGQGKQCTQVPGSFGIWDIFLNR
jgi:serine/threonine-protein kinase